MNTQPKHRQLPDNSPFANVLVVVLGAIAIAISFVIGIVAFVALAVAVLILGVIIWIRLWWLGMKNRQYAGNRSQAASPAGPQSHGHSIIEGEFHVIPAKKGDDNSSQT